MKVELVVGENEWGFVGCDKGRCSATDLRQLEIPVRLLQPHRLWLPTNQNGQARCGIHVIAPYSSQSHPSATPPSRQPQTASLRAQVTVPPVASFQRHRSFLADRNVIGTSPTVGIVAANTTPTLLLLATIHLTWRLPLLRGACFLRDPKRIKFCTFATAVWTLGRHPLIIPHPRT